ncbi:Eco57I restriction-modification methylase domain-containing protein [Tengunoibacter tsumagoiensis]|uniref:site-specific DNA-methyltransferase (adenine-specific) n=1 Tax=Tengunoibacter tsumagoiensis TaxID=2014871 RepID=A0A402A568_9CHLR|nr:TaqI-like C-terminal specificity domain-containing protein [Tengunoibacter tsumagoiensis]GCE14294.1 hypothetical protein KTT_41530 [Tengunoibacter tsumagoiensis]
MQSPTFEITEQMLPSLLGANSLQELFSQLGYAIPEQGSLQDDYQTSLHTNDLLLENILSCKQLAQHFDETSVFYVYYYTLKTLTAPLMTRIFQELSRKNADFLVVLNKAGERKITLLYVDRAAGIFTQQPTNQTPDLLMQQSLPEMASAFVVGKATPRKIEVDLLHPKRVRVILRVLNRLAWPRGRSVAAHCHILHSAFDVADWSEEYFNNRALFSDHYLINLHDDADGFWQQTRKPGPVLRRFDRSYQRARELYDGIDRTLYGQPLAQTRDLLLTELFTALHFDARVVDSYVDTNGVRQPSYRLYARDLQTGQPTQQQIAICLAYGWGRELDTYQAVNEEMAASRQGLDETNAENPGAVVVNLLDQEGVDWAILTNGKLWRLYSAKAHSRATNYYEIDLAETLAIRRDSEHSQEAKDAFRYFWLFFSAEAFLHYPQYEQKTYLDYLFFESQQYALTLGDSLKKRIFEEIFAYFAEGLVHSAQRAGTLPTNMGLLSPEQCDKVLKPFFNATLTYLYRLLFLLYAESRDLLPLRDPSYYKQSLTKLKLEIADCVGDNQEQALKAIEQQYSYHSVAFYHYLNRLFRAVDKGDPQFNLPTYNGGLFLTESSLAAPVRTLEEWERLIDTLSPQELDTYLLSSYPISDRHLVSGLDKLARNLDPKSHKLVQIDYKSLGVRQLGSIYEGLLEFKLRVATEEMVEVKGAIVPARKAPPARKYASVKGPNDAYIENDRSDRKSTGSYYTPDYIVEYIVEQTVGPILDAKEQLLIPRFRQIEEKVVRQKRDNKEFERRQIRPKQIILLGPEELQLVDEFFDIKVLDPAMGSGHFLVETVDYITRRMLKFLERYPNNPIRRTLKEIELAIASDVEQQEVSIDRNRLTEINLLKRQVLKRCIFGVDLNRMAVELAKVSVWLDSFTLGAPLSFLDHHMKWGNSLLGGSIQEVKDGMARNIWGMDFAALLSGTDMMLQLSKRADVTVKEVHESQNFYTDAEQVLAPYKRLMDVWISEYFGNKGAQDTVNTQTKKILHGSYHELKGLTLASIEKGQQLADKQHKNFFHYDLEFPEVFFNALGRKPNGMAGFDAVIGNPPYVRQEGLSEDKNAFKELYKNVHSNIADLYTYFIERGHALLHNGGGIKSHFGMITANKFMRANYGKNLRKYLINEVKLEKLIDFGDLPVFGDATAYPVIISSTRARPSQEPIQYALMKTLAFDKLPLEIARVNTALPRNSFEGENWTLSSSSTQAILDKLKVNSVTLEQYTGGAIRRGILTGFNEAFIIDKATREQLIAQDPKSAEIIKPFLVGENVRKYTIDFQEKYLIWTYVGVPIKRYPAIFQHLQQYQEQLEKRWDKGKYWWELRHCDYYPDFEKPKIVFPDIAAHTQFAFDSKNLYAVNTTYIMPIVPHQIILLTILNSSLVEFFYRTISPSLRGGYMRFIYQYIAQIPIYKINFATPQPLRTQYLVEAKQLYQTTLSSQNQAEILAFVQHHLSQQPEASDVVQDLLAYLAEVMLDLNKQKQAEQRRFLEWLVLQLHLQPQPDKQGLALLKYKDELLDYPGDYQKHEEPLSFERLQEILLTRDNLKRMYPPPTRGTLELIKAAYSESLQVVLPLKEQLRQTDALIDQIVYRLYGLTAEEIQIVEGER